MLENTYMEARPTTSMKKGWLYRTSCDEKNHEIAHMMMTRGDPDRAMSRYNYDDSERSRSSDDPDPAVMI